MPETTYTDRLNLPDPLNLSAKVHEDELTASDGTDSGGVFTPTVTIVMCPTGICNRR